MAEACAGAARGLAAAYTDVEAGRQADHPKLAELRACLLGFRSLHPVNDRQPQKVRNPQKACIMSCLLSFRSLHPVSYKAADDLCHVMPTHPSIFTCLRGRLRHDISTITVRCVNV